MPCASSASMSAMGLPREPEPADGERCAVRDVGDGLGGRAHGLVDHVFPLLRRTRLTTIRCACATGGMPCSTLRSRAPRSRAGLRCGCRAVVVSISWTRATSVPGRAVRRARRAAAAAGDGGRRRRAAGVQELARQADLTRSDGASAAHRAALRGPRGSGRRTGRVDAGTRAVPDGHRRGIPV